MTRAYAFGRVGLLGNPSDIYGGRCISFTINKKAIVDVEESDEFLIIGNGKVENSLEYNGVHDLVKATVRKLGLFGKNFTVNFSTDIPLGSGLSASSAIVIACIRALSEHFSLGLNKFEIAETALRIETEELRIAAGFQDRYVISFEGIKFMDFSGKEFMRRNDPYGKVEHLDVVGIPFFLCLGVQPKSSALVHNSLREKFLKGEEASKELSRKMNQIADLASTGKKLLLDKEWREFGCLMNMNHKMRTELGLSLPIDERIVEFANSCGALGAKVAGSGGAVVVLSEDPQVFEKMSREFPCFRPSVTGL